MQEPITLAITPVATAAKSEYLPSETLKPANSIVASDGIGISALSGTISRKIPGNPRSPTTLVAKSASFSVTEASTSAAAIGTATAYVLEPERYLNVGRRLTPD